MSHVYSGVERRGEGSCPLSFDQAEKILLQMQELSIRFSALHEDLIELKNSSKEMKISLCDRITNMDSRLGILRSEYDQRKSYYQGSVEGAKIGAKSGVILVIATVLGGGLLVFLIMTGQIDILGFLEKSNDLSSASLICTKDYSS